MQKTSGFHRLLAVLVSVLLAVCCLPLGVLAEEQKVPVELDVKYTQDSRGLGSETISLGELTYRQEAQVKGKFSWEDLYGKMKLPADTKVKNPQTGECELAFSLKGEGRPWKAELTVEVESAIQHPSFRVRFEGVDKPQSVGVTTAIRPGGSVSAWDFLRQMTAYKNYVEAGYRMTGFTVSGDDHAPYTEADHYGLTAAVEGKTLTVQMEKVPEPKKEDVTFTLLFVSDDDSIRDSKTTTVPYDPQGTAYDLWNYLKNTGAFQAYRQDKYTLERVTLPDGEGEKTVTEAGQLAITPDLAGKTLTVRLHKEPVSTTSTVHFALRFLSTDNQIYETKEAALTYEPEGTLTDLWDFLLENQDYKTYAEAGYQLSDYVIPRESGELNGVARGIQPVTTDLEGQTVIVHLVKQTETKVEQVPFRLAFRSTDGNIADDKDAEVPYDANGKSYDLWSYIESTGAYKGYQSAGYTVKSFEVPHPAGNKRYTGAGQFTVTPALRGAIVTVELDKPVVSTTKTVDFTVQYRSNDKNLDVTKQVSAQYDPEGVLTDLWDYLVGTGTVQSAKQDGYTVQDYELDGRTVKTGGVQAVNGELAGKTVTVHLYKEPVSTAKTVHFELRFLSTDNRIHETKAASLTYEPEGVLTDLWDFLLANGDYKNFAKDGYQLSDYVISRKNGDLNGVARGIQAVTTDLEGQTVIVHLEPKAAASGQESRYTLHFVEEQGKEFQPAVTVTVNWKEGQKLNLMAQLQEALKTVSAKGYTFKTLTAWNGTTPYKGTELVAPGSWELAVHCAKKAEPAAPQKPAAKPGKPAAGTTQKPTATPTPKPAAEAAKAKPAQAVVKPAAPAVHNTKILPKTGLQLETPVVFGVMLFAALAGAAVYLFAIRKKLN